MDAGEFSSFVEKYKEHFDRVRQDAVARDNKAASDDKARMAGKEGLQSGTGVGQGLGGSDRQADVKEDKQRQLHEDHRSDLSEEMQQITDDFYRAISGGGSQ
ncbi:MAG: hypothetical protein BIFFINMI_03987 [Phycisphaerae bacterium]|nr:hypothetical protein [Phycisphaerae bacterium]